MLSRKRLIFWLLSIFLPASAVAQTSAPTSRPTLAEQQQWWAMQRQPPGPQTFVRTHDPCAIFADGAYYLFSTGRGISVSRSDDLYHWTRLGFVFDAQPSWAAKEIPASRGLWAPDISLFDGVYHLYYSVSSYGSRRSCIGLAINKTLDPNSPDYRWIDQGKVVETHNTDNYNAIDPNLVMDETGQPWLVFGSCWDGIRICKLERGTGKPSQPNPPLTRLVHRPNGKLLEGPFVMRHDGWFYMFISYDACCRGVNSTYNIRIGRSKKVDGPYIDMDGVPMLEGGGTSLLASYGDVRGPGHNGVLTDANGHDWMVHHFYDAANYGLARLQVRRIVWMADGWAVVGEPVDRPAVAAVNTPALTPTLAGPWKVSVNFAADRAMEFRQDGSIDVGGSWKVVDGLLELNLAGAPERCAIDDGGEWFVGRDRDELVVRGRRGK